MPRVIEADDGAACSLDECVDGIDAACFNPRDERSLVEAAHWLRRLGYNRTFLGDMLLDELVQTHGEGKSDSAYTPQSLMLSGYRPGFFLRANIWPATHDATYRASGAGAFAYGVPHDHNFDFLTLGYHGPGYESDYWEYDYEDVLGLPDEPVTLRDCGRRTLSPGTILHYRAHRDVHAQWPPQSLSISINVMATDPAQGWCDQYGFDPARGRVTGTLSPNSTETWLRVAVACGSDPALDYAAHVGQRHPSDRLRLAAFEALADRAGEPAAREAVWRTAERSGNLLVARMAARQLAAEPA